MDRREAREEIERILAESIWWERVYQLRPWTCYTAKSVVGAQVYHLLGFTKVMHPDDWNPDRGAELAKRKALAFCVKKIMIWMSAEYGAAPDVCPWDTSIRKWCGGTLSQEWYAYATAEMERRYGVVRFNDNHGKGLR